MAATASSPDVGGYSFPTPGEADFHVGCGGVFVRAGAAWPLRRCSICDADEPGSQMPVRTGDTEIVTWVPVHLLEHVEARV